MMRSLQRHRACLSCIRAAALALVAVAGLLSWSACTAEDLGIKAQTYPPDPDGREEIKATLRAKEANGDMARFWQHYRDQVLNAIRHPAALPISTSYAQGSELRAVSYRLPNDFVDQHGRVVAHRGQLIEPLALAPLTTSLAFIDGRDAQQVQWAVDLGQRLRVKIVLTGGSPIDLRERYRNAAWQGGAGVPFYFDQREIIIDSLARTYGIKLHSVPAVLAQEGKGLRISYGLGVPK